MPACLMCSSEFEPKSKKAKPVCCLACHPFGGKRERDPSTPEASIPELLLCLKCLKPTQKNLFYRYPNNVPHQWCKACTSRTAVESQRRFKIGCIEYKGGLCVDCGKMPHPAAMDFHHLDPKEKDFKISSACVYPLTQEVKTELDKCVLVCKNCHAMRHYRQRGS